MAMPAPPVMPPPLPNLGPQLRVVKVLAREQERLAASMIRKAGWWLLVGLLAAAVILAVVAEGRRSIDPDQRWFWEPDWLRGELEAEQEIATGAGKVFKSTDEFLAHLDEIPPSTA